MANTKNNQNENHSSALPKTPSTLPNFIKQNLQEFHSDAYNINSLRRPLIPTCPDCKTSEVVMDLNYICSKCGRIIGTILYEGSEWRNFEDDGTGKGFGQSVVRIGGPENPFLLSDEHELTTMISEAPLNSSSFEFVKYHNRGKQNREKRLLSGFHEISHISGLLNLSKDVQNIACEVFRDLYDISPYIQKHKIKEVIATVLWVVTSRIGYPRDHNEICQKAQIEKNKISRVFKEIKKILRENSDSSNAIAKFLNTKGSGVEKYLPKFCDILSIRDFKFISCCQEVAVRVTDLGLCDGRRPVTIAGAIIFLIYQLCGSLLPFQLSLFTISQNLKVSETTIGSAYSIICTKDNLSQIIPHCPKLQKTANSEQLSEICGDTATAT